MICFGFGVFFYYLFWGIDSLFPLKKDVLEMWHDSFLYFVVWSNARIKKEQQLRKEKKNSIVW